MKKSIKVKEAQKHLSNNGARTIRCSNGHEIWKKGNKVFSLPVNHGDISPGVARKLLKFSGSKDF